MHTYTIHLTIGADCDDDARAAMRALADVVESGDIAGTTYSPSGYLVDAAHVTDADDWAENVGTEDICSVCGTPGGTARSRDGRGSRVCAACVSGSPYGAYPIEDVRV